MNMTENDVMNIAENFVKQTLKKLQQQIELHNGNTENAEDAIIFGLDDTITWVNKGGLRGN